MVRRNANVLGPFLDNLAQPVSRVQVINAGSDSRFSADEMKVLVRLKIQGGTGFSDLANQSGLSTQKFVNVLSTLMDEQLVTATQVAGQPDIFELTAAGQQVA